MTNEELKKLKFQSKAVYYSPDPETKSVSEPIYMTSNFQYNKEHYQKIIDGDRESVYIYTRCGNPTERKLEKQIALLEGSEDALVTSSGMAAISTLIMGIVEHGDNIIADRTTYSTSHEFFEEVLPKFGVETKFVNTLDLKEVENAIDEKTKIIYAETIANPIIKLTPIKELGELAHKHGLTYIVDNTFASPRLLRPIELGADFVVESATKFIGGHNDVLGGIIAGNSEFLYELRWERLTKFGGTISPFNAWLLLRGLQTMSLRVDKACENALKLAKYLENHPKVEKVSYPGLESHPNHELAKEILPKFGSMINFKVKDEESGVEFLNALKLCCFAGSLGGVRTTLQPPATCAFLDIPEKERNEMGIYMGMIRVSTGIEDIEDIIYDFEQAFDKI
ncbi:aminotransferase class I/II-fold pyridoxal phosphate-dependent enzyme [Oceanotoga sp. DSM 15011]|uniref:trans-sulfuration enzyme family protein n=1 Tax=Oceanotoga sp. DSM 15011 TaxID=2984951 RepID=UPI0021F4195A|nr:aminotransferase class I/II-fold pyridoxal phosphate-dependent enzyme [Oceanotoga sp. DSM 15011]UYO99358.1 aminotransferase class I/II-fold pyridoxal phosphate-dependent enzyme [Oceanotoga sp. DSM 15011]